MAERNQTPRAARACFDWLAFCISIGWRKSDLDALQNLWWQYHDDEGRLIA